MRLIIVLALLARAAAAGASTEDEARGHYERGLAKYNIADFDAAIDEFKQSYELSKAPRLLFNIAQAYRLKKDWEHALYFYNTYLRNDPKAPNREDVETRIDEMRQKLDGKSHPPDNPPADNPPLNPPPDNPPPLNPPPLIPMTAARAPTPRTLKAVGLTTLSLGAVMVAVGGGLLGLAGSDADKVAAIASSGGTWTSTAQHTYDEGSRSQSAAIALISVGGVAVTAGVVVTVLGVRKARQQRR